MNIKHMYLKYLFFCLRIKLNLPSYFHNICCPYIQHKFLSFHLCSLNRTTILFSFLPNIAEGRRSFSLFISLSNNRFNKKKKKFTIHVYVEQKYYKMRIKIINKRKKREETIISLYFHHIKKQ